VNFAGGPTIKQQNVNCHTRLSFPTFFSKRQKPNLQCMGGLATEIKKKKLPLV
jgi:hypothetical protein